VNPEGEKGRAAVGMICRKGGFKPGIKELVGDGIPNNSKYDCWQIKILIFGSQGLDYAYTTDAFIHTGCPPQKVVHFSTHHIF